MVFAAQLDHLATGGKGGRPATLVLRSATAELWCHVETYQAALLSPLEAEQVVAKGRFALPEIEGPAAHAAAEVEDHAVGATTGDLYLRGQRPGTIAPVDDVLLDQPAHARVQNLLVSDERRLAADLRQHPLERAIVQRQHVVLRRLDQEEPLQLRELPRVLLS